MLVLVALLACSTCLAAAAASPSKADADATRSADAAQAAALRYLGEQVMLYERTTWRWQRLMGVPPAQTNGRVLTELSVPDAQQAVALWRSRAEAARRRAQQPPHLSAWLCIHRYEGSWTDGGAPYYGGLQMDIGFQRRYGYRLLRREGTADHWTPLEQIWVAERALRSGRGFYPWPNTARSCGLI